MNRRRAARRTANRILRRPPRRRSAKMAALLKTITGSPRYSVISQLTAGQEALYGGISEHTGFSLEASAARLRGLNEMMAASERLGLYDLELEALGLSDPLGSKQADQQGGAE